MKHGVFDKRVSKTSVLANLFYLYTFFQTCGATIPKTRINYWTTNLVLQKQKDRWGPFTLPNATSKPQPVRKRLLTVSHLCSCGPPTKCTWL
jgi:hypothetical protein